MVRLERLENSSLKLTIRYWSMLDLWTGRPLKVFISGKCYSAKKNKENKQKMHILEEKIGKWKDN